MFQCDFFFKQNTAYEMRISDWSSDVCSSDLRMRPPRRSRQADQLGSPRLRNGRIRRERAPSALPRLATRPMRPSHPSDRQSVVSGKSVSVRLDLGGRRFITKNILYLHHLFIILYSFHLRPLSLRLSYT